MSGKILIANQGEVACRVIRSPPEGIAVVPPGPVEAEVPRSALDARLGHARKASTYAGAPR